MPRLELTESRRVSWAGDESDPAFDARLLKTPDGRLVLWNGWVCPAFDRENAQRLIDYNNAAAADGAEVDTFEWDGDVVLQHWHGDPGEVERIEPRVDDGVQRWTIGAMAWTWMEVS